MTSAATARIVGARRSARAAALVVGAVALAVAAGCAGAAPAAATQPGDAGDPASDPGFARPFHDELNEPPATGEVGLYAARGAAAPAYGELPEELQFMQRLFTAPEVWRAIQRDVAGAAPPVLDVYEGTTRLIVYGPIAGGAR